jgi:aryl-phospho-beta-D-glucosidase BglC (GH1 family)
MNALRWRRTTQVLALGSVLALGACLPESSVNIDPKPTGSSSGGHASSSGGNTSSSGGNTSSSGGNTSSSGGNGGSSGGNGGSSGSSGGNGGSSGGNGGSSGSSGGNGGSSGGNGGSSGGNGGSSGGSSGNGAVFRVNADGRITKNGTVLPVRCGAWFGLQGRYEKGGAAPMELYIGNPGYASTNRTIEMTMQELVQAGVTVVRMPVVHQTLDANDPMGREPNLKNTASVRVANSRLALEQWIKAAAKYNIQVLLDIHSCSNYVDWRKGRLDARPPFVDATRSDYNYKREDCSCADTLNPPGVTRIQNYNEAIWLQDLRTLAGLGKQLGVDNILGIDIFNEPWDYTWEEWKTLTEHAYQAVNEVNPNILIFMQGIGSTNGNQDGSPTTNSKTPHGNPDLNPNWGENLFDAGKSLPNVPRDRLVFSPHTYGPSVAVQPMFMDPNQPSCKGLEGDAAANAKCNIVINGPLLRQAWEEHFGYLKDLKDKDGNKYAVVVGEWGGNLEWPGGKASARDKRLWTHLTDHTVDEQWQNVFVEYMVSRGIESCYWSINPESGDTGGWYGHAYDPAADQGWGVWLPFEPKRTALLKKAWGMQ